VRPNHGGSVSPPAGIVPPRNLHPRTAALTRPAGPAVDHSHAHENHRPSLCRRPRRIRLAHLDHPEDIKQWNAASDDCHTTASTVELCVGGAFSSRMEAKDGSFGFDFAGASTQVIPQKRIETEFGHRKSLVEFIPQPPGVLVRETFDAKETHSIIQFGP
jgi:hypothetical protein